MDSKSIYETCGAIAEALPPDLRADFARLIRGYIAERWVPRAYGRVEQALPDTVRPMLWPLVSSLRGTRPEPRVAAARWLRDAGWES